MALRIAAQLILILGCVLSIVSALFGAWLAAGLFLLAAVGAYVFTVRRN